ncbi:transcriptional regulator, MarR family [Ancylobacter novellus DSM 506]|uniref:Transcriptional regulator, MarR family n=1 Tax=Ancylobacter novellus (strain ATCC 8093 / DSM 506 / JCM 20403 / CCM 1077 / IAM 12100 / NBRC 12443 / NCIMB 10456) TaxID=639283 RepID=D7A617_ANCN5|nr:MarR family winged helix-turn-helix transcriptional regulator [Ancylobacter novellus]ADH90132.1 transcriptional regulator, MarR family [Ancylobacter novellus DSM 506]
MKDGFEKKIGQRLHHVARLQRALAARRLQEIGLFPGQETVLKLLAESDGRTMTELAGALKVRPPTASKTVGRLSAQGLLVRRASEGDARLVRVHLTDEGRSRAGAIDSIWDSLEETMTAGLDGKERKRLRKLLRKIEKNLSAQLGTVASEADEEADAEGAEEESV